MKQIIVVLHNIRSVYNVGAILRTCEGMGVAKVIYSGYTPRYNDQKLLPHLREKLNHQIAKSALGAEVLVPQEDLGAEGGNLETEERGLLTFLQKCAIMEGYTVVGLENNLQPEELERQLILGKPAKSDLGEKIVLVLGEEVDGIAPKLRERMDYFLEIPMYGRKESFNVSVATGIALWGLQNCYES